MKDEKRVTSEVPGDVVKRKLIEINGSLYVNLPRKFVETHRLRAGDQVPVIMSAGHIKIVPYEKVNGSSASG